MYIFIISKANIYIYIYIISKANMNTCICNILACLNVIEDVFVYTHMQTISSKLPIVLFMTN